MQNHETGRPSAPAFATLPNEIISLIFLRGTELWREFEPLQLPFPVLVAAVCRHWRISYGTPELWTFIVPPLQRGEKECLKWTTDWMERSGAMLLSVVIDYDWDAVRRSTLNYRQNNSDMSKLAHALLNVLVQHVHRLRRLDFRTSWSVEFVSFVEGAMDAPHLEELSLHSRRGNGPSGLMALSNHGSIDHPRSRSWHVPNLRTLNLRNFRAPSISNLTSLTVYRLLATYEEIRSLFTASPHLARLVLHHLIPIRDGRISQAFERISAPSLLSVAISVPATWASGVEPLPQTIYIFDLLLIPNLTYLEIDGNASASILFKSTMTVPSSLKKLRICNGTRKSQDDHQFYSSLSGLQELELIRTPIQGLLKPDERRQRRLSMELRGPQYHRRPMFHDLMPIRNKIALPTTTSSLLPSYIDTVWPKLRSVTVDVLDAEQLVPLTQFIKARNSESDGPKIQTIHLSSTAMRHLTDSMMRKDDEVSLIPSRSAIHRIGGDEIAGTKDVKEWLSQMIEVKLLSKESLGLLDAKHIPLGSMP